MTMLYPWQQENWKRLLATRNADRLPHGLILGGPEGTGKGAFARHWARSLLCESALESGGPCGTCRGCNLMAAGTHPDFLCIVPEEDGRVIKIDQVRELVAFTSLKSQFGGFRAALIEPAEAMNRSAANSLLKTLEEPPPSTVIVLVAHAPASLPVTVRSRCQYIGFAAPADAATAAWLAAQCGSAAEPRVAMALTNHAPLAAAAMIRSGLLDLRLSIVADLSVLAAGKADPVQIAARWAGSGHLLKLLIPLFQDVIRLKMTAGTESIANTDLRDGLIEIAKGIDLQRLFSCYDLLNTQQRLMNSAINVREQDLLEEFAIHWTETA